MLAAFTSRGLWISRYFIVCNSWWVHWYGCCSAQRSLHICIFLAPWFLDCCASLQWKRVFRRVSRLLSAPPSVTPGSLRMKWFKITTETQLVVLIISFSWCLSPTQTPMLLISVIIFNKKEDFLSASRGSDRLVNAWITEHSRIWIFWWAHWACYCLSEEEIRVI